MNLNEVKTLLVGTIKQAFANKKTLDKFDGSSGTLLYNGQKVNNFPVFVADDAPVGNIIAFMGNNAPKDYLVCDGAECQIADYPLLAQHFIDEFGSVNFFGGDGTTTFAVPDLRGEFLRGTGTAARDSGSGAEVGEHQDASKHAMTGTYYANDNGHWIGGYSGDGNLGANINRDADKSGGNSKAFSHTINTGTTADVHKGKPTWYTSRPTNTSVLYCIKYQITQNNISKDMVNYSLEEQVIGSWINGKPIYEKTFVNLYSGNVNVNTFAFIPDVLPNVDKVVNSICRTVGNNGENQENNTYMIARYYKPNNGLLVQGVNDYINIIDVSATIQYTKTTDAENSFTPDMLSNIKTLNTVASDDEVNDVIGGI